MLEQGRGNLLEADAEALVNTVNCVGVMGKGVALQFKQAYPENFRIYQRACRAGEVVPGRMLVVPTGRSVGPRFIINFPTKRHWKGRSRIEDIRDGLFDLIKQVERLDVRSIAVPPLGCGNGGLDWVEVKPLIEEAFAKLPHVRTLVFPPNGSPEPATLAVATKVPSMTPLRAALVRLVQLYRLPVAGYRLTGLELQKLMYFVQAAGEPLQLEFVKHQYGPYAEKLNHALQCVDGHLIVGYGDRTSRSAITLRPGAVEAADAFLTERPDTARRIERVARLIEGFETTYGMELLATVHWVAHAEPAAAIDPDIAVAAVQNWSPRKRDRLHPNHIRKAWQRLDVEGWLADLQEPKQLALI